MLAEKFLLVLEQLLRTEVRTDEGPRVVSKSPHVPIKPDALIAVSDVRKSFSGRN